MSAYTGTRAVAAHAWTDLDTLITDRSIVIQPLGAMEQHGPHLPVATDYLISCAVSQAVVEEAGDELDLWLLPPLAVTKSNEHTWAPGTVSLEDGTLRGVLDDLGRSVARLGARKLLFLNSHGGNSAPLAVACREIRLDHGLMTFLTHPWAAADQGGPSPVMELGMGVHGGHDETSMVMHLHPELVHVERFERAVPESLAGFERVRFGGPVSFGWSSRDFGPSGVIGDPTSANAEHGKQRFENCVQSVIASLDEVARFEYPDFIT